MLVSLYDNDSHAAEHQILRGQVLAGQLAEGAAFLISPDDPMKPADFPYEQQTVDALTNAIQTNTGITPTLSTYNPMN